MNDGRFASEINATSYIRTISWLSDIWGSYVEVKLKESFERCGITSVEPDLIILN
jgi:hypothetical protein